MHGRARVLPAINPHRRALHSQGAAIGPLLAQQGHNDLFME